MSENKDKGISEEEAKKKVQEKEKGGVNDQQEPTDDVTKKVNQTVESEGLGSEKDEGSKNLGKAQMYQKEDDDYNADMLLGWHSLYLEELPSKGMFYPEDLKIHIRAANVDEIKHFSTLNEEDLYDINDKLNHILKNCTRFTSQTNKNFQYKDILEEDRFPLILSIKELTFKEGENKIVVPATCPSCEKEMNIELLRKNLQYNELEEDMAKYYSPANRVLEVNTKSYGILNVTPPTIGLSKAATEWARLKSRQNKTYDKGFIQIMPYMYQDWRGFLIGNEVDEKKMHNAEADFKGMDKKKYMLYYRLAEKMKIGMKDELSTECESCSEPGVSAQITFQNGLKSLFIISDIDSELL